MTYNKSRTPNQRMGELVQDSRYERGLKTTRRVDAQKDSDGLLETMEEDQNSLHEPQTLRNRRRESMGVCEYKKRLLANCP